MQLPFPLALDPLSFAVGFVVATLFWWLLGHARPLWVELRQNLKSKAEAGQIQRTSGIEMKHRQNTLRRAQGMHLAAPLFALDEILQEPRLLAPPPHIEPDAPPFIEDIVAQTLPYMPAWPELAALYNAPTLSLPQALSGGMHLVIVGQPGSGKTVALAHLASLAARRSETLGALKEAIPFLIHVADLDLPLPEKKRDVLAPIITVAAQEASMFEAGRIPAFVHNGFRSGRALLLLDGFDELTPEGQNLVADYLKLLLAEYPRIRIVTSGAPEYLDGLMALGFAPLALAAWSNPRAAQFVAAWSRAWSQFIAAEERARSESEPVDPLLLNAWVSADLQGLTPLEITLKVWGAYAGDTLGPHALDAIATHIRRLAPPNTPLAALEALAMQVVLTAQPAFDPRKARQWVKSFELPEEASASADEEEGPKAEKKKRRARTRIVPAATPGLLGKMAASGLVIPHLNGRMRFTHPVFGGFLAGRALSSFKAEEALLAQPDWVGKLLAMRYLAAYGDASTLVKSLLEWSRLPMHRPLLSAARWLRDAPRQAPWRGKLMASLATLLQSEGLPLALRGQALAAFVASKDAGVPALFRQLMSTLSFDLMQLLALGSGAVQDVKAIQGLQGLLEIPSLAVQRAACLALAAIGSTEALEILGKILLHGNEEQRRAAAEALANESIEGHPMLKDGATLSDVLVRHAVVYGLARLDEKWATDLLEKMQIEDGEWLVRNAASEVLAARQSRQDPRLPRPLRPPWQAAWLIQFAATQGVGIPPGSPAIEILTAALSSPKVEERLAALPYLASHPNDGTVKAIYNVMYGDDSEVRERAYLTLWEIGASGYKLPHPTQYGFG